MNLRAYLVTESCFHVAYLVDKLKTSAGKINVIIRDKNNLDEEKLSAVHRDLARQTVLSPEELARLEDAYQSKLSRAELALIKMQGVPESNVLSLPGTQRCTNLNAPELLNALELESFKTSLAAGIFLDCILKPRWLEIFEHRIVNAHSAILPRARGMHAIEQIAAIGDPDHLQRCAGGTIHYIDEQVDMGSLISAEPLDHLWQCDDIWQVKAASYLKAFDLLTNYLQKKEAFNRKDSHPYTEAIGPEFKLKDFNQDVAKRAEQSFLAMRARQLSCDEPVARVQFIN